MNAPETLRFSRALPSPRDNNVLFSEALLSGLILTQKEANPRASDSCLTALIAARLGGQTFDWNPEKRRLGGERGAINRDMGFVKRART